MINFIKWIEGIEEPIIYIDLDETLVRTVPWENKNSLLRTKIPDNIEIDARFDHLKKLMDQHNAKSKDEQLEYWTKEGAKQLIDDDGEEFLVFTRPHAIEFVTACNQMAKTSILTSGKAKFQIKVANLVGLPYQSLYGRDTYQYAPQSSKGILIDDLDIGTSGVQEKLRVIGLPPDTDRHIEVPPFQGKADNHLVETLSKVKEIIKA